MVQRFPALLLATNLVIVFGLCGGCGREKPPSPAAKQIASNTNTDGPSPTDVPLQNSTSSPSPTTNSPTTNSPVRDPAPHDFGGEEPSASDPIQLRDEAMRALQSGQEDVAFELARQAMRLAPDDPQVIFLMAMILGNRHRFPEAIQMLDALAKTTPDARLPALGQTADWMVRFGQWTEAENRYLAILKEVPDSVLVHRNLASLFLRQGRRLEAAKHLRYLCRQGDVTEAELRSLLTIVHPLPGDSRKPELDPVGALGIARNEIGRGDWTAAREHLENQEVITPEAQALLGRIYVNCSDDAALLQWSTTAPDEGDLHADAWFAKGAEAASKGEHARAVRFLAEAVLRDQTDGHAYALMSRSLKELGATEASEAVFNRSELIKQTQTLGAEMADTETRDDTKLATLVDLLKQLHRPLEAIAWRGMRLVFAQTYSSVSEAESQQTLAEIEQDRFEQLQNDSGEADRSFVLCGIDPDAFSIPNRQDDASEPSP